MPSLRGTPAACCASDPRAFCHSRSGAVSELPRRPRAPRGPQGHGGRGPPGGSGHTVLQRRAQLPHDSGGFLWKGAAPHRAPMGGYRTIGSNVPSGCDPGFVARITPLSSPPPLVLRSEGASLLRRVASAPPLQTWRGGRGVRIPSPPGATKRREPHPSLLSPLTPITVSVIVAPSGRALLPGQCRTERTSLSQPESRTPVFGGIQ
jgi:hypothetical protein